MEVIDVIGTINRIVKTFDLGKVPVTESLSKKLNFLLSKQIWTSADRHQMLDILSLLLLKEDLTLIIAENFSSLLLELLSHASAFEIEEQTDFTRHELIGIALGKLVGRYPVATRFCIQYFEMHPSIFDSIVAEGEPCCKKQRKDYSLDHLKKLLQASFQLLAHNCHFFRRRWNWGPLIGFTEQKQADIRWLACHCIALVAGMSRSCLQSFLMQHFNDEEIADLRIKYADVLHPSQPKERVTLFLEKQDQSAARTYSKGHFINSDVCENVISISGVLVDRIKSTKARDHSKSMVLVPSIKSSLRSLALGVAAGDSILLQGPVGCGKTALVEHFAAETARIGPPYLIKVQLGDQMDSKLLVGSHCCTDVPGEFIWHPGPLTQAMTNGCWLLLEDINHAPMDIISLLVPVLQSRSIVLPGHAKPITAASGFQLFATQRLLVGREGMQSEFQSHADILSKLWRKLIIEPMSRTELEEVIITKWPMLKSVSSRILDIYFKILSGHSQSENQTITVKEQMSGGRLVSTRDLLKWCQRISTDFDIKCVAKAVAAFQDALNCFCQSIPSPEYRLSLAKCIGTELNLTDAKVEYYCKKHKPDIAVSDEFLKVGRAILKRNQEIITIKQRKQMTFAHTRQAISLLESVAVAVRNREPVLLVGETGTGKTSVIQYLANLLGYKLTVINMNQQSDSVDLLGGYKPVELKLMLLPLHEEFEELFNYTFSHMQNMKFLGHVMKCFSTHRWQDLFKLMIHTQQVAVKKLESRENCDERGIKILCRWKKLGMKIQQLQIQIKHAESALAFSFVEGSLVKAIREGEWILLDEINLAEAETLECLGGLLESSAGSVLLAERGDREPVTRHPNFCLFACMNPATDIGKRDLPAGIRNRFTEFFMEELEDETDLVTLVDTYLKELSLPSEVLKHIVLFYIHIRKEAMTTLTDGTGHHPQYSLRTLCRALRYTARNACGSVPRSLYEGFILSFLTQLDRASHPLVIKHITTYLIEKKQLSVLKHPLPKPPSGQYLCFEGYWIQRGSKEPLISQNYILTPSIRQNLRDLVRVVSAGKQPVLLQGETSVGKTSLVQWLASASGNHCVRVNNHEHTDLQEYLGSYCASDDGKLTFKKGVLAEAMMIGHWIILDELNLAPTEVLEALNRVLDDNRELYIPEIQLTIKAHPQFMLFATQNPPGLYGGRKMLSRAFRNRFVELHFDEIPSAELERILHERCAVPPSYCKKLVAVMLELQLRRRESGIFAGKKSYITLRDLFRWGERYRLASQQTEQFYDWNEHLANEGYILLAGRVRKQEEAEIVQQVIEKQMKCKINPKKLFTTGKGSKAVLTNTLERIETVESLQKGFQHIVWTFNMKRLAVLVGQALKFNEPVLLIGETGCGKTTVCQLFAVLSGKKLFSVNCHMHSESSDFLGGLRPVRHNRDEMEKLKLFEWVDGPLITSMKLGDIFLADEISLADDSVLERLNSVLEPERTILLAEKAESDNNYDETTIIAKDGFQFLATMNPGGDFGKKELSPALRNRFTEIWCPSTTCKQDLISIIKHNLISSLLTKETTCYISKVMIEFLEWFKSELNARCTSSIRDILAWTNFINQTTSEANCIHPLNIAEAYIHGGCLVYLDSLGCGNTCFSSSHDVRKAKMLGMKYLADQMKPLFDSSSQSSDIANAESHPCDVVCDEKYFGIHPFYITAGSCSDHSLEGAYTLTSPTVHDNSLRLLRAMQLSKPVLLEGVPGVGKTSLVASLAKASGNKVVRINLSEQTDISDLFGADLPIEGKRGEFAWRDGPLLQALKFGSWILLDELNLASQSVLEGLNACLDHRGEIFIPELGRSFQIQHKKTWILGCQNPHKQGGARKGLPLSFLNRFTQVYIETMSSADLMFISHTMFPVIPTDIIAKMVEFNQKLSEEVLVKKLWGQNGSPWEFNLRDIFRWCEVLLWNQDIQTLNPGTYVELIFADRMRNTSDKTEVVQLYKNIFDCNAFPLVQTPLRLRVTERCVQVGYSFLHREGNFPNSIPLFPLHYQLKPLQSLMKCIEMKWMTVLVGSSVGKTSLVNLLAALTGHALLVLTVSSEMDTTELLGGFEQADLTRHLDQVSQQVEILMRNTLWSLLLLEKKSYVRANYILERWYLYQQLQFHLLPTEINEAAAFFQKRIDALMALIECLASNMLSNILKQELQSAKEELMRIEKILKSDGTVSCGGRFEWVDSMLTTAVKRGYWLLIDDVNFCSPSVLDRLNGLLEPNGVLTISEKGVIGEEVPTIKPHQNFRLILAMDPRNGEISRAMRNRGVEIYMLEKDEDCDPMCLDLCKLIHSKNLHNTVVINELMKIHKRLSEEIKGAEKTTLLDLLKAALICSHVAQCDSSSKKALWESCHSTFTNNVLNNSKKQEIECILEEEIGKFPETDNELFFKSIASLMPSCLDIHIDAELSHLKEESILLHCLLHDIANSEKDFGRTKYIHEIPFITTLSVPFNSLKEDKKIHVVTTVVQLFMEIATTTDWELRKSFLCHITSDFLHANKMDCHRVAIDYLNKFISKLNIQRIPVIEELTSYVKELFSYSDFSETLLDLRWNIPLLQRLLFLSKEHFSNDSLREMESAANRFLLLLFYFSTKFTEEQLGLKQNISRNQDSLLDLAKKYHDNKITVNDLPHPVLQHLLPFLSSLNEEVFLLLGKKKFICQTEAVSRFRNVIQHCYHFAEACSKVYERHLVQHQISLFSLHWIWMEKNVFPFVSQYQDPVSKETANLSVIISVIRKNLEVNIPIIHKLRPKLVKCLGSPFPFQNDDAAMIFLEVQRLSDALDIKNYIHDSSYLNQCLSLYKVGPNCMEQLLSALPAVFNSCSEESLVKAKEIILNVQETMIQEGLIKGSEVLDEVNYRLKANNLLLPLESFIQLLPLLDYLYILNLQELLYSLMKRFSSKANTEHLQRSGNIDKHTSHKLQLLRKVGMENLLYPYGYLSEICLFSSPFESSDVTRIFLNFFTHLQQSPSSVDITKYLSWNSQKALLKGGDNNQQLLNDAETASLWKQNDTWAQLVPLRTFTCMMLQGSLRFSPLTLGNFHEKSKQLGIISHILWKNVFSFSNRVQSFRSISSNIVQLWFHSVVSCLLRVSSKESILDIYSIENAHQLVSQVELPEEIYHVLLKATSSVKTLCCATKNGSFDESSLNWALGEAWVYVGLLTMQLLAPRDIIDPVEKWKLKLDYCQSELENIITELSLRNMQSLILTGHSVLHTSECHPIIKDQINQQQITEERITKLKNKIAYRPINSQFQELRNDINHYLSTIGSSSKICTLLKKLDYCKLNMKDVSEEMLDNIDDLLHQVDKWNTSQSSFVNKLQRSYPLYCDLVIPFISGIKQMVFGMQIARHHISTLKFKTHFDRKNFFSLEHLILNLIKFPSLSIYSTQDESFAHFISKSDTILKLENILNIASNRNTIRNTINVHQNLIKLTMSALLEIRNEIIVSDGIYDESIFRIMNELLQFLCKIWVQQNANKKEKDEEEECLYQYHSYKGELQEEKQDDVGMFFPTYFEEFRDVNPKADLKAADASSEENPPKLCTHDRFDILNLQDMIDIWSIHTIIINKLSNGMPTPLVSKLHSVSNCDGRDTDYLSPFMLRYETARKLLQSVGQNLDVMIDCHTVGSNLLANYGVHKSCIPITQGEEPKYYDIYHMPNPSESIQCYHLLRNLVDRVQLLLEEFPDHPSLKQILLVTGRIMSFSVTAPLMKFLTGLEIVLTASQDWEVNSHKGVSLIKELSAITELIIKWRKLELRCWSDCLNSVFNKHYSNCTVWWLHLYQLVMPFITHEHKDKDDSWKKEVKEKFPKMLSEFFDQSTLGEYRARLNLLHVFVEHAKFSSLKNSTVVSVLYNIYQFYHQFLQQIDNKISLERKPIEKEIKEYIKIARWNDLNFWAVKQAVEKSHHTIYKHMKQFDKILTQPVRDHLLLHESSQTDQESHWEFNCVPDEYVSSMSLQKYIEETNVHMDGGITKQKYKRMTHLCKKIFRNSQLRNEINYLSKFAGNIASAAKELASLDISEDADSERRKKEAHHIHARKQKALSDLFKELAASGLSYKLGLILWKEVNIENLVTLPPIDISELLLMTSASRAMDLTWKNLQDGINNYFNKSVVKHKLMTLALKSPSKELNPSNIERCKGFIGHLFHLLIKQHHSLFSVSHSLIKIRQLLFNIEGIVKDGNLGNEMFLPPQTFLGEWMRRIHKLSVQIIRGIELFIVILKCCPDEMDEPVFTSEPLENLPPLVSTTKASALWNEIFGKANSVLELSKTVIQQLPKKATNTLWFYEDYVTLCSALEQLSVIAEQVNVLRMYAESDDKENSLADSLRCIIEEIGNTRVIFKEEICNLEQKMHENIQSSKQEAFTKKLAYTLGKLTKKLLLTAQKEYLSSENIKRVMKEDTAIGRFITDGIVNKFNISWENMHLAKVEKFCRTVRKLIKMINSVEMDVPEINRIVSATLPFIDQFANLLQFLVIAQTASHRALCKLLFILLHIFTELLQKGFCLPLELQKELIEKEGAIQFKDIEDGGLGDGEGSKDVSERLESEDQLEEAHKPEDYNKKTEDTSDQQDIEEEEQGIEMSDDFNGKLNNPKAEDNVSEESSDDDDDHDSLDKKMGDVDEEEEALNTELWGSDNESDDDGEMKEDDSGQGNTQSGFNVVAKDESKEEEEDGTKADKENNEGKPPEMQNLDEYDGEYPNNANNTEETPDALDLPEDIQLDKDINDIEDSHEENMEEDKNMENMEDDTLKDEQQQMETDEKDKSNDDNEEYDLNEQENEEQSEEKGHEQEYSYDDSKEESHEESKAEETEVPSRDDGANVDALPSDNVDQSCSKDAVQTTQVTVQEPGFGKQDASQQEQHGNGSAECDDDIGSEAHEGSIISSTKNTKAFENGRHQQKRQLKDINEERTLGSLDADVLQVKTVRSSEKESDASNIKSDLYEHIKDADSTCDTQTADTATEQQVNEQMRFGNDKQSEDVSIPVEEPEELQDVKNISAKSFPTSSENQRTLGSEKRPEEMEVDVVPSDEASIPISTMTVNRGPHSSIHTQPENLHSCLRDHLPQHYEHNIKLTSSTELAEKLWQEHTAAVQLLVQELCEQLRLVLEPTKMSKLKGDYRSGKRLNMRKIIPYIASQFRKDKIWLRRTKPSKREYQITLAVDDSSSMADNKTQQLAFQSLALLAKSLSLLEAGEISVIKFGEDVSLLHPFGEPFTDHSGAQIMQQFTFSQGKTLIRQLLNSAAGMMIESRSKQVSSKISLETAQLLIVISDGHGIFSEGREQVKRAVHYVQSNNIFLVLLILDNPENKGSILDMKYTVFRAPDKVEVYPYMEKCPFPFYIILRNITSLPLVLGEALRQWFELVTSMEH